MDRHQKLKHFLFISGEQKDAEETEQLDKFKTHFSSLSERFGFPVPITEEFVNGHAFHGLKRHDAPDEALALFQFCLFLSPDSAEAYLGMGEAYEKKGSISLALVHYEKAIKLNPANQKARGALERLRKKDI